MTVRGGGVPTCFLGSQCRKGEWARRFGASLPMRMTASWFGPRTHRIQGCGATDPRPKAGSPLIVIPTAPSVSSCSKLSRYGLTRAMHVERLVQRPTLTAPARDGLALLRVGTKKRAFRSNKETDEGKDAPTCRLLKRRVLDNAHTRKPRLRARRAVRQALWGFECREGAGRFEARRCNEMRDGKAADE